MANNLKTIKKRVRSAKNISQITKAMQMVAASKMKKAQKKALEAKPYSDKILEITLSLLKNRDRRINHPLLKIPANDDHSLVVVISTNKGLCGSLNLNLFRKLHNFIDKIKHEQNMTFDFALLGKKGLLYILQLGGGFLADFSDIQPFSEAVGPINETITQRFINNENTSVWLIYNSFINALKQEPKVKKILPIVDLDLATNNSSEKKLDYLIEPSYQEIINNLLPFYLEKQIRAAILDAEASEYSARMIAMKNATDNAYDLMANLSLVYNKVRQQMITMDIIDIVTAKISMEKNNGN